MARTQSVIVVGTLALSVAAGASFAQECDTNRTLGTLINEPGAQPGYTLIDGRNSNDVYLIDNEGRIINEWISEYPAGNMGYLLEDGSLLRAADPGPLNGTEIIQFGDGGLIERFDWDGELIWSFVYNDPEARQHHDIEPMPNGNILILAWEYHPIEEVWARGRDPKTVEWDTETTPFMLSERILEVDTKTNEVLWIWSSWDRHIQNRYPDLPNYGEPSDHPGKIDFNYLTSNRNDWIHANAIDYNEELDQILISSPRFDEIWIINRPNSTEEARGPAGDLIYRWGNPAAYGRGDASDQILHAQHDPQWVPEGRPGAGNITIYNNGNGRPDGDYSTVEELTPPLLADGTYEMLPSGVWGPEASPPCFIYDPPEEFYSPFISGAQRLENGNTLACAGNPGRVVEMTPGGEVVWEYISPVLPSGRLMQGMELPCNPAGNNCSNKMFRAERYGSDHSAFVNRDLTPGAFLELYPACPGDLDGNGTVDGADLTLILGDWGPCCGCASDVNYDGEVNGADLTIILGTWGEC